MKKAIKVSLVGFAVETLGLVLDIMHHLSIGIETPEGLFTFQHTVIFAGFVIMSAGVYMTWRAQN